MPGGNDNSARPPGSKRRVSTRVVSLLRCVTATLRALSVAVHLQTTGRPFGVSSAIGRARSLIPALRSPSSQSASAATTLRYASSDAPPRNAQRHRPPAVTKATRCPLRCSSVTMGRGAPRRASLAVRAIVPAEAESRGELATAVAGGKESHCTPDSAAVRGDDAGRSTYQSPPRPLVGQRSSALREAAVNGRARP